MDKSITVTRIQDIQSFESLRDHWDFILSQSNQTDVFLTWEWLFAWWKNLGQHTNQLWLLLVKDAEKPIGIAPFMLNVKVKSFVRFRRLENIGNPDCDTSGIISVDIEHTVKAVLEYLIEHGDEWDMLQMNELLLDSVETDHFLALTKNAGYWLQETIEEHYYLPLREEWERYYNGLSKNLRHNLKRRMKRAQELGNVTFNRYADNNLKWERFEAIFKLSEKSNFPELYSSEMNKSFHEDLFTLMQSRKWIQIETLTINEKPIAYQYGFIFNGRYEDWRGGFDTEYEFIAPGKLLMMLSLEDHFKVGLQENDFLRGNYAYKTDWMPHSRKFVNVKVFNNRNVLAILAYLWTRYIHRTIRMPNKRNA